MQDEIIFLLNPAIQSIYAVSFLILWVHSRDRRAILGFGLANIAAVLGFLSRVFLTEISEVLASVLTHVCFLICNGLIVISLCYRANQPLPYMSLAIISVVSAVMSLTAAMTGAFMAELVIANISYGLFYMVAAQSLSRAISNHFIDNIIRWIIAFMSAHHFVRVGLLTMFEPNLDAATFLTSQYLPLAIVIVAVSSIMLSTSVIGAFMVDQFRNRAQQAALDPIGGLLTRRPFEEAAKKMLHRAIEQNAPVNLLVVDIDNFKQVNDIFGHQCGDEVIGNLSKLVSNIVRDTDIIGRIGGEEFCIIVWNCKSAAAMGLAERVRATFGAMQHDSLPKDMRVTVSIGVAEGASKESYGRLFARADAALYAAKTAGRNTVILNDAGTSKSANDDSSEQVVPTKDAAANG